MLATVAGGSLVGGDGSGDPIVTTVVTDSRLAAPGSLFVALRGERRDGHRFVEEALRAGAVAAMVEAGRSAARPRVEVEDPLRALRDLAAHHRTGLTTPVAAITGSTGKTSTKDLLGSALGPGTWAAPRSYNNEIGVPLTVLGVPQAARAVVLEVGSRGRGDITWLAPAIRPHVAVLTNAQVAHLETFGSLEGVREAKWELMEALEPGGVGVVPADDQALNSRPLPARLTFGRGAGDVAVEGLRLDDGGRPAFALRTFQGQAEVRLSMAGAHQAVNAAAAAAAALALGRRLEELVPGLERATASPWRMELHRGRFTVVNDAYNANPASVRSALESVAAMPGRHLAVLGRMAELGMVSHEEHLRMGRLAADLGFAAVVVVGDDPGLAEGAGSIARAAVDSEEASALLADLVEPGDVVLVKGSRVVGLERLAARLAEAASS
ncbi:MAG: UDP-N-acetylmuramoyl-tripeptide--D-alanyl-D-alanine ligase [Actinomycetota bacterium]|nr:UDP-N-acetylmuramoyl-tripeptide--D-alanyl-D-alanine ligase [Actinomycetota bacterium]